MWLLAAVLVSLLGAVICRPPIVTPYGNFSTEPISQEYREWLERHTPTHRAAYPSGFKLIYFSQDGRISRDTKPDGNFIKIVGSPGTANTTLYVAALELYKMMRHAPEHVFRGVANSVGGAGIFTAQEKLTVFPSFARYKDTPECKGRCDGSCKWSCTFDGRKVGDLGGVTATLSLVLEDNVLCSAKDPYRHRDNILVHEFAHMVDKHGLNATEQAKNRENFNKAKAQGLWPSHLYSMANSAEYFGESSGAFFRVNLQSGMLGCSYGQCRSERDARDYLQSRDPDLYHFLAHIWTSGHPDTPSRLNVCYH